jgi:hypothetical protein
VALTLNLAQQVAAAGAELKSVGGRLEKIAKALSIRTTKRLAKAKSKKRKRRM